MALFNINKGWLQGIEHCPSPHCSTRGEDDGEISLQVVHNISLPPGQFGGEHISALFLGQLDPAQHPYFCEIYQLRVSAHCLIRRDGSIIQYVSFNDKAWHAGVSSFAGREKCNDYSIGIELEGCDDVPYTEAQYRQLAKLSASLQHYYPQLTPERIVGHSDIAPGRKTDPGPAFDWQYFHLCLQNVVKKQV